MQSKRAFNHKWQNHNDCFFRRVEGSINTTHHHYTTFDIGNMSFVLEGNYPIRDGDEVVCYAIKIGGHYLVETLKNFTRNYSVRDRFGSLRWYYLGIISGIISGILSACAAAFFTIMIIYPKYTLDTLYLYALPLPIMMTIVSSSWSFISFKWIKIVKRKDKQNKIIENYNPHLTQAQLENESKKNAQRRFSFLMGLLSLLFWALVGALATAMLFLVGGVINEIIKAQWANSIVFWFKDDANMPITWVVATLVLLVLNFINKRKQISVISIFMRLFLGLLGGFGVFLGVWFALYLSDKSWLETYKWIVFATWAITTLVLWIFGVFGFIRKRKQNKITN